MEYICILFNTWCLPKKSLYSSCLRFPVEQQIQFTNDLMIYETHLKESPKKVAMFEKTLDETHEWKEEYLPFILTLNCGKHCYNSLGDLHLSNFRGNICGIQQFFLTGKYIFAIEAKS